jgi:hypothetical protein
MPQLAANLMLSCPHIELPAMPWTSHHSPLQTAVTQRSPLVRTDTIHGEKFVTDAIKCDDTPSHDHFARSTDRKFFGLTN